jgi:AcrR family transcriptional regulator
MSSSKRGSHREALLAAARELLRTHGYGRITARDLVAASGTNLGSIGYHFGSKEALLNEAIGQALQEWAQAIRDATRTAPAASLGEWMASALAAVLDDFEAIRPYFAAFVEALPRSARSPELAGQLAAHYDAQRERVAGMLADAFGDALAPGDARALATVMIATVDGLVLQSFADPGGMPTSAQLAQAMGRGIGAARAAGR